MTERQPTTTSTDPATDAARSGDGKLLQSASLLGDVDLHLFNEGTHLRLYDKLGAHPTTADGVAGTYFAVWAPNAEHVSVIGDFNEWQPGRGELRPRGSSGIWEAFVPGVQQGALYKFHIRSHHNGYRVDKADPYGFRHQLPPATASIVWDLDYSWSDQQWIDERKGHNALDAPISIYEVHAGSWMRVPDEGNRWLSYRELAEPLADHVERMGFTHVEFLPLTEHPFYGSWGYQVSGFFAPTSRYGTPQDLMYLIDVLHQRGIGVIMDWVPGHFPTDEHGLGYFDGTHLYEHADPRQGFHPDWQSAIFNYGRDDVRSFLISSAIYWLDKYHIDGLRVDGVASMLYLDYSRAEGEWIPNVHGGRENVEAIGLIRQLNEAIYSEFPGVQTFAEESTSWPMVSRPTYVGGLGFGYKWDMGWMHDTLGYIRRAGIHRKYHHNELTFRSLYAFHENFVLPLSHDEVVHGKGSLLSQMGGDDDWQKFANLRLLYSYMYAMPGKKLLFMGSEWGQWAEWNHEASLDWHQCDFAPHRGLLHLVSQLNALYRSVGALHRFDCDPMGFEWIEANDVDSSVLVFGRRGEDRKNDQLVAAFNFTPVPRHNYRIGVDREGWWSERINSDAQEFGGSGHGNLGRTEAHPVGAQGRPWSLSVTIPPLGAVFFTPEP